MCERVGEPQRIRVQRGAGDERPILCAVEPVARERMTEGRHVDAELVRASGPGRETQERQLAVIGEHLILRAGGETVGRDAALDERALGAGDGSVDDAARRRDAAAGEGAVFAPQLLRMQRAAQQPIDLVILKSRSPTCGVGQRYDGTFTNTLVQQSGLFAEALLQAGYTVKSSDDF